MRQGSIFKIGLLLGVVTLLIFLMLGFLTRVRLDGFTLHELRPLDSGFQLSGEFQLKNPGTGEIEVQSLTYNLYLKHSDKLIGAGSIPSFTLEKQSITPVSFEQDFDWIPSPELLSEFESMPEAKIRLEGVVSLFVPWLGAYTLPLNAEIDLKAYLTSFKST